jgi:predicted Zn-ribbon and HTH transcriptional regulator
MRIYISREKAASLPFWVDGSQVVVTIGECLKCGYVWRLRSSGARVCPTCASTQITIAGYEIYT